MNFRVFIVCLSVLVSAPPCLGAMIYLKDGSVEESDKVWEKDGYIHFILKGTKKVEIRYSKEIIDRIEGAPLLRNESVPPALVNKEKKESVTREKDKKYEELTQESILEILSRYEARLDQLTGIGFYDPRRPAKYWVDLNSHHNTLKQAVADLAEKYDRSPAWVIANMGKINDLGVIHRNLIESIRKSETKAMGGATVPTGRKSAISSKPKNTSSPEKHIRKGEARPADDPDMMKNIPFYNPGKPLKYWSDANTGHHTIREAINAIAQEYGRSPAWVEKNMGDFNDLGQIHRNLQEKLED